MAMVTSNNGLNLIKKYEGCYLKAYLCPAGVWTIGYGHTAGVKQGMTITQAQADSYLKSDVKSSESAVNKYVTVTITQNQFDSLVSFTFNLGAGSLKDSTLLKKLNAGDYKGAADEFPRWNKANGQVLQGLVNRRAEERTLFLNGSSSGGGSTPGGNTGNSYVKTFQSWLNTNYKSGLVADGIYGANTKKAATVAYQKVLGVSADGIFGAGSQAAVVTLKSGSKGNAVYLLQGMLYCLGYNPNGFDGTYGAGCVNAVKSFQSAKKLSADGVAGKSTMAAIYGS